MSESWIEEGTRTERSFICWFIPQMITWSSLDQVKDKSKELHLGLLHWQQGPKHWRDFFATILRLSEGNWIRAGTIRMWADTHMDCQWLKQQLNPPHHNASLNSDYLDSKDKFSVSTLTFCPMVNRTLNKDIKQGRNTPLYANKNSKRKKLLWDTFKFFPQEILLLSEKMKMYLQWALLYEVHHAYNSFFFFKFTNLIIKRK